MMENYTDVLVALETLLSTQSLCEMSTEFNMWWPKTTLRRLKRNIEETRGEDILGHQSLTGEWFAQRYKVKTPYVFGRLGQIWKNGMLGFLGPIKVGVD